MTKKCAVLREICAEQQFTHLYIVSLSSIQITVCFSASRVSLIDATYDKTYLFRLPLLHIVGVTATNNSYIFAYCFMERDRRRLHPCDAGPEEGIRNVRHRYTKKIRC